MKDQITQALTLAGITFAVKRNVVSANGVDITVTKDEILLNVAGNVSGAADMKQLKSICKRLNRQYEIARKDGAWLINGWLPEDCDPYTNGDNAAYAVLTALSI